MNIFGMVREKMAQSRARKAGITTEKLKELELARKREMYKLQQETERKEKERYIKESAKIKVNKRLARLKRRGTGIKTLTKSLKSIKKNIGQGPQFGLSNNPGIDFSVNKSAFDLKK